MTVLNQADAIFLGDQAVDAVYLGTEKVWPAAPPPSYADLVLAGQPLAYYRFDDDPGSNVAADSTPNARHGTYGTGITRGLTGPVGSAIEFGTINNIAQTVTLPSGLALSANSPVTVEYWRRSPNTNQIDFTVGNLNQPNRCCQGPWANVMNWDYGNQPTGGRLAFTATSWLNNSAWFHLVLTAGDGNQALYIDGALRASRTGHIGPALALQGGYIGGFSNPGGAAAFAFGSIAEFAVYDKALTAQQVADHYAAAQA